MIFENTLIDNRFILLGVIGRGNQGAVHEAFDKWEQQSVAIKLVRYLSIILLTKTYPFYPILDLELTVTYRRRIQEHMI